ncbi:MAG: DUF1697 domain-containing protein [Candidatus Saccharimonadales bacterium]
MMKYVAFLRGINVGGRVVKMTDLKACFEKMGLANISTLLQSGNVLFMSDKEPAALKRDIETGLTEWFGYAAKVQVLSVEKLEEIIAAYPFGAAGADQHDYVIFLENGLERSLLEDDYALADGEQVKAGSGVVYWRVDKGLTLQSSFAKLLTKAKYKDFNTNRNLKTLRKITAR